MIQRMAFELRQIDQFSKEICSSPLKYMKELYTIVYIRMVGGDKVRACRDLCLSLKTIYNYLNRLRASGLDVDRYLETGEVYQDLT